MSQPWKCPDCATWIAPGVREHRCDDPPATSAVAVPIGPQPIIMGPAGYWSKCLCCGAHYVGWHYCTGNGSGQTISTVIGQNKDVVTWSAYAVPPLTNGYITILGGGGTAG